MIQHRDVADGLLDVLDRLLDLLLVRDVALIIKSRPTDVLCVLYCRFLFGRLHVYADDCGVKAGELEGEFTAETAR